MMTHIPVCLFYDDIRNDNRVIIESLILHDEEVMGKVILISKIRQHDETTEAKIIDSSKLWSNVTMKSMISDDICMTHT